MSEAWSRVEVEAIVTDYLEMLSLEIAGVAFNKTTRNADLRRRLVDRSHGSVEFKHANISAVLRDLHQPYIDGYKPRGNYQNMLYEIVEERVLGAGDLLRSIAAEVIMPAVVPAVQDILACEEAPPELRETNTVSEDEVRRDRSPRVIDYFAREASNASLGRAGEEFVLKFERARLISLGKDRLADDVEHVAATRGDGLGFDIRSFETDGRDRLIEVKTTAYSKGVPFFVTKNELAVSRDHRNEYHLYRLFKFRRDPRLFRLAGALDATCRLDPTLFSCRVA